MATTNHHSEFTATNHNEDYNNKMAANTEHIESHATNSIFVSNKEVPDRERVAQKILLYNMMSGTSDVSSDGPSKPRVVTRRSLDMSDFDTPNGIDGHQSHQTSQRSEQNNNRVTTSGKPVNGSSNLTPLRQPSNRDERNPSMNSVEIRREKKKAWVEWRQSVSDPIDINARDSIIELDDFLRAQDPDSVSLASGQFDTASLKAGETTKV